MKTAKNVDLIAFISTHQPLLLISSGKYDGMDETIIKMQLKDNVLNRHLNCQSDQ